MPHPEPERREHAPPGSSPLAGLTPEQAQAATYGTGPLLLIAGPGAGKTRTLTHRIAYLLESEQARPDQILAVTFSVRAAGELRLRLADLLGQERARAVTAATFHSVCARLLREHAHVFGRSEQYTIYDPGDMRRVFEYLLCANGATELQQARETAGEPPILELSREIACAKNRLISPTAYRSASDHPAAAFIAALWEASDAELANSNAFDFDDLLLNGARLLSEHPPIAKRVRSRWRWVLVDEYQDVNVAQAELVLLISGARGNLTVVGDDDQIVFGWRGASPEHMVGFADRYPRHETIALERNFRSRAEILRPAARCVQHNRRRTHKPLIATRGIGGEVQVKWFPEDWHESHWVTRHIADAVANGISGPEILVLARTSYAMQSVQLALARAGIPHRVLGRLGLCERAEVKDALAYLALLVNPCDAQAFRRAIQSPRRGVGPATASLMVTRAREKQPGDLICACQLAGEIEGLNEAAREALVVFGDGIAAVGEEMRQGRSVGHVVLQTVMLEGGLVEHFEQRRDTFPNRAARRDAERVLEDLRSLCRAAQAFDEQHGSRATLREFLEHAVGLHAQKLDGGEDRRVTVSTIHCSPSDELIATKRGPVPIAELRSSDRLISYHRPTNTVFGNSSHVSARGYAFKRSVRDYEGDLVVIETSNSRTRVTPNHRVVVRFDVERFARRWAVYLMRRGAWWRVGICTTLRRPYVSGGLNGRLATEQADEGWILSVHETRHEAVVAENLVQATYGLPGLSFEAKKDKLMTSEDLARIHDAASASVRPRAHRLLLEKGLLPDAPLYRRGPGRWSLRGYFVTEAANLVALTGRVEMLTLDAGNKGVAQRARVSTQRYRGPVYGLDVPPHHYYVSGGAIVHNSAKGAEAQLVLVLGCEEQLLPSWQSIASVEEEAIEEERRLFYVACTRAKDRLVLTHAQVRGGRDTAGPSRFLTEAGLVPGRWASAA